MGSVRQFELESLRKLFKVETFIETGTGRGAGLRYAAGFPFDSLWSCDVVPELAQPLHAEFAADARVHVHVAESVTFLPQAIGRAWGSILFWLDAHFPGADHAGRAYAAGTAEVALPLEQELGLIHRLRPAGEDVLLIDDLRIYEDGPFAAGDWPARRDFGTSGIGFVAELFAPTHQLIKSYKDEGYVVLLPRKVGAFPLNTIFSGGA